MYKRQLLHRLASGIGDRDGAAGPHEGIPIVAQIEEEELLPISAAGAYPNHGHLLDCRARQVHLDGGDHPVLGIDP